MQTDEFEDPFQVLCVFYSFGIQTSLCCCCDDFWVWFIVLVDAVCWSVQLSCIREIVWYTGDGGLLCGGLIFYPFFASVG